MKQHERDALTNERRALDAEIQRYHENVERIRLEEISNRKRHQDDLKYQISEKERHKQKELQDKAYDERVAKLWEIEYQKKINEQRQIHLQRVIYFVTLAG